MRPTKEDIINASVNEFRIVQNQRQFQAGADWALKQVSKDLDKYDMIKEWVESFNTREDELCVTGILNIFNEIIQLK